MNYSFIEPLYIMLHVIRFLTCYPELCCLLQALSSLTQDQKGQGILT
jgi:hypothetical protein